MPAIRERVYLCPAENGGPGWVVEFPLWWDRAAFFDHYGKRQIDTGNPIYVDYAILLMGWEARAFDRECREHFTSNLNSQQPFVQEKLRLWDTMLKACSWVIVESYEWESGLS